MSGRRFVIAVTVLAAAVLASAALAACGGSPEGASETLVSAAPSPSRQPGEHRAGTAALALARLLMAEKAWRYEPAGDVTDGREGADRLVFAHLYRLRDESGTPVAVFDAEQFYSGAPAEREAARDGTTIQGATYRRNAHVHRQELPLADDCPIVYAWAETELSGRWPDLPGGVPLRDTTYWLVIDDGHVTAMVWEGY